MALPFAPSLSAMESLAPSETTHSSSSIASELEKKSISESPLSDSDPWSSKTPEKPIQFPRRARNSRVALSLKEVRNIAQGLHRNQKRSSHPQNLEEVENPGSSADCATKSAKAKTDVMLPEKYEMLVEFFNCLLSSIRLLQLKGQRTIFTNISPQIETLTNRRFSYGHLAQLKYILPEAISIEKTRIRDERTLCIMPDLQVTLQLDAFENSQKQKMESGYSILKKIFHARLSDFFKSHAEGDEIPGETLPEPFNQRRLNVPSSTADVPQETLTETSRQTKSSLSLSPDKIWGSQLPSPSSLESPLQQSSHLPQSFQRRFSQKIMSRSERIKLHLSTSPLRPIDQVIMTQQPSNVSKCPSKPTTSRRSFTLSPSQLKLPPSSPLASCKEEIISTNSEDHTSKETDGIEGTPLKSVSTPSRLVILTPELQTPKRYRLSPGDDSTSPNKSVSHPTRIRSLKFNTPEKNTKSCPEENESQASSTDADIVKFLPEALLQSVREKERRAMEDRDAGLVEAKRRRHMIVRLPKLFDMIHLIFQSMKRSVITKQELLYRLIVNHNDVVDKEEVEEQLKLLQELIPDWISGKMSSSGDFLFCVDKTMSPESIHARLAEVR